MAEVTLKELFISCMDKCVNQPCLHPFAAVQEAITTTRVPESWLQGRNALINLNYAIRDVSIKGAEIPRILEPFAGSQFLPLFRDFVPTADASSDEEDQLI